MMNKYPVLLSELPRHDAWDRRPYQDSMNVAIFCVIYGLYEKKTKDSNERVN